MPESPTFALADFIANLKYEQIPAKTVGHLKDCILDTIGCGLHGSTTIEGKLAAGLARDWSEKPESTIWGFGQKTACANAVLANCTLVKGIAFDDTHHKSTLHPGCVTIPTAFALAERLGGVDGKKLLTAVAAGYETIIRVGMSVNPSARLRGFQPVSICAPFGSAAVAAKLLGLDTGRTIHALGTAGTMGAGLLSAQFDSMVQRFMSARSAQSGLIAAFLAQKGFTGVKDILEAPYGGFCRAFADQYDLGKVTEGLGQHFEAGEVGIRIYATAASVQTAIEGIKVLQQEYHLRPETVEKITVRTNKAIHLHCGWEYRPQAVITAQMNIAYCLAVILLEGDASIDQFREEKIRDPKILEMAKRVQVVHDPALDGLGQEFAYMVKVAVKTRDGRTLERTVQHPKGTRENPLSLGELVKKFSTLASKAVGPEKVDRIIEAVHDLEKEERVSRLVEFFH